VPVVLHRLAGTEALAEVARAFIKPEAGEREYLRLAGGAQSVGTRDSVSTRGGQFCGFRVPVKGNCSSRLRRKTARSTPVLAI
jgi:hypothetical protein